MKHSFSWTLLPPGTLDTVTKVPRYCTLYFGAGEATVECKSPETRQVPGLLGLAGPCRSRA